MIYLIIRLQIITLYYEWIKIFLFTFLLRQQVFLKVFYFRLIYLFGPVGMLHWRVEWFGSRMDWLIWLHIMSPCGQINTHDVRFSWFSSLGMAAGNLIPSAERHRKWSHFVVPRAPLFVCFYARVCAAQWSCCINTVSLHRMFTKTLLWLSPLLIRMILPAFGCFSLWVVVVLSTCQQHHPLATRWITMHAGLEVRLFVFSSRWGQPRALHVQAKLKWRRASIFDLCLSLFHLK